MQLSLRLVTCLTVLVSPLIAQGGHTYPLCGGEHHYRWTQKVDTSLETVTPEPVTVTKILSGWSAPAIGHTQADWCKARIDPEKHVYLLTGWVRFVKEESNDLDWHIELTANRTSPMPSCIVAEILSDEYGDLFAAVRDSFLAVTGRTDVTQKGDTVRPPVKIKVTGAAFYDGWHRSASGTDGNHGHCNKSQRALWEIHPVYRVEHP
jgi:hypothetical protein